MNNPRVEFNGQCAFAVSLNKIDIPGGRQATEIDGKIYRFANPVAQFLYWFLPGTKVNAIRNWHMYRLKVNEIE